MTARVPPMDHRVTADARADAAGAPPSVSVVMPVRNAEAHLDRALASVAGQTMGDFELLLIDDASDDATAGIGRRWAGADPRVRVEPSPSRGIVAALNHGIALAAAPLIARMDGDDACLPTRFETQRRYLAEHRGVVAVGSGFAFVDEHERPLCLADPPLDHDAILAAYARHEAMAMCHPTTVFRTADARAIGGYDASFQGIGSEDLDFFLRLASRGRLANVPEPLLLVRKHATSYTRRAGFDRDTMHTARRRAVVDGFRALGRAVPPEPAKPPTSSKAARNPDAGGGLHLAFLAWWGGQWTTAIRHALPAVRGGPRRGQAVVLITLSLLGFIADGGLRRLWGRRYTRRGRRWPGRPVPASLRRRLAEPHREPAAATRPPSDAAEAKT